MTTIDGRVGQRVAHATCRWDTAGRAGAVPTWAQVAAWNMTHPGRRIPRRVWLAARVGAWRFPPLTTPRVGYLVVIAAQQVAMTVALAIPAPSWGGAAYAVTFAVLPRLGWAVTFAVSAVLAAVALITRKPSSFALAAGVALGTMAAFGGGYFAAAVQGDISWLPALLCSGIVARDLLALRIPWPSGGSRDRP